MGAVRNSQYLSARLDKYFCIAKNHRRNKIKMRSGPMNLVPQDEPNVLGEGPMWNPHNETFYWVDIEGFRIDSWRESENDGKARTIWRGDKRPNCLVLGNSGDAPESASPFNLLVTLEDQFGWYDIREEKLHLIPNENVQVLPISSPGKPKPFEEAVDTQFLRFNDGKCDRKGRFYIGNMVRDFKEFKAKKGAASMYRVEGTPGKKSSEGFTLREMIPDITISNGIAFSNDDSLMYYADSKHAPEITGRVYCRENNDQFVPGDGDKKIVKLFEVRNPETGKIIEDGVPDGATVDTQDRYYSCLWGGERIDVFDFSAKAFSDYEFKTIASADDISFEKHSVTSLYKYSIPLPGIEYPTCACFGGPNLDRLFVTSASIEDKGKDNGRCCVINSPEELGIPGLESWKGICEAPISF